MSQTPTIGRIVHYRAHGSPDGLFLPTPRAAIITKIHADTCVELCVFSPVGILFTTSFFDDSAEPACGTWHWPPCT